jgi:hypothetical protein
MYYRAGKHTEYAIGSQASDTRIHRAEGFDRDRETCDIVTVSPSTCVQRRQATSTTASVSDYVKRPQGTHSRSIATAESTPKGVEH